MNKQTGIACLLATVIAVAITLPSLTIGQDPPAGQPDPDLMREMMEKGMKLAQPGPQHESLQRFVGDWTTETSMMGMPPEQGTATFSWVLQGRFIRGEHQGSMMGMPSEGLLFVGFDNYKKKYNTLWMSSLETSMMIGEGLANMTNDAISFWGTMNEWMTGEHDKTIMWRYTFVGSDQIDFEMHDLGIVPGETKVFTIKYTRKP